MAKHSRRHVKIKPNVRPKPAPVPKEREITVAEIGPRGPLALENQCVGILREGTNGGVVVPDPGYPASSYGHILIRKNQLNGAPFGMKVVCEIINPSAKRAEY